MKNFRFENIWLLSNKDRSGLEISFHPNKNLILGRNHTGKSSLIKSLFLTLGAKPSGKLEKWDEHTISIVTFTVDQKKYRAVHQSGSRALFLANGTLLGATGDHQEWTKLLSDEIGFNLVLTNKNSETVPADAKCFFLPFYINQDGSWLSEWDTFIGMQQFSRPVQRS